MSKMQLRILAVGVLLCSVPALAFQERQVAPAAPSTSAGTAVAPTPQAGAGLATPEAGASAGKGTEVRIPGLGKLGVLPKLDFGLDILYGAAEERRREESGARPHTNNANDDLTVQGRIKHRF